MDLRLAGKTVLITGSSSGIGRGIAEVLAREGCNVVINSHSSAERAWAAAGEIAERYGVEAIGVQADVSFEEDIEHMFDYVQKTFSVIELLVNNAGGPAGSKVELVPLEESPSKYWDAMMRLNLYSAYWATRRFARDLIAIGSPGAVVNIASKSALLSSSIGNADYVAAKAGIIGLTRSTAKELVYKGIRVNGVIPGYCATTSHYSDDDPKTVEKRKLLPTGRFATPEDMGYGAAMLLSPLAGQINGALLDCTGGMLV